MAITYSWIFPALDVAPSEDGLTNVVKVVHWRIHADDGEYRDSAYGTVGLPAAGQPFTDYADLTEEIVKGWVVEALGTATVETLLAGLAEGISRQKNPPIVAMPPPWA